MPYPAKLTPAETRLVFSLQKFFRPEFILADYYLPKADKVAEMVKRGTRTVAESEKLLQIDCLAVNKAGIFVFESKDYQGWIYGHGERVYWTQVVKYGKEKQQFYSPVRQNGAHVAAVRGVLGDGVPIFSVIVFGRQAELKVMEGMPENTMVCTQAGLYNLLEGFSDQLDEDEMERTMRLLRLSGVNPTAMTREVHSEEVEQVAR